MVTGLFCTQRIDSDLVLSNQAMSPQSANQASGVNNCAQNPNPSSNQQVDLTLRLGAFGRITINPPPMNPQHAPANFTGTNTDQVLLFLSFIFLSCLLCGVASRVNYVMIKD